MNGLLGLLICMMLCVVAISVEAEQTPALPETVVYAQGQRITFENMAAQLKTAEVIFVGEMHDHRGGHALELAILKALHTEQPRLGLALEMFERDVQYILDEYLTDHITNTHFQQSARPWPNYKADYAPLVEYCKANRLPVIATNAPRRYVNIVSRKGPQALDALPKSAKAYLPPLPLSLKLPEGYDRALDAVFGPSHNDGPAPAGMPTVANLKAAQALWDASMADGIVRALKQRGGPRQIVHMNGAMHSDFGYGIVARLREQMPRTRIALVTMRPTEAFPNLPADLKPEIADFVLLTPSEAKEQPKATATTNHQ